MPAPRLHPLPFVSKLTTLGRGLAAAQVLKETLSVIFLGLPLVKAEPLVLLAALPGVVLYLLHWQLALGRAGRLFAAMVWSFTLVDELWGLYLFGEFDAPTLGQIHMLRWSYFLGLGFILLALGELGWRWMSRRARVRRNVHHYALLGARPRR